ncbi:hypothetical protein JHK85_009065 [Glycine max]|nr:hypothetical protein JHK87_008674 [Glycine soja]KAG5047962.1 hypothetical protein JHK85_009065 [Glycine max]KHN33823.1 hypothetical protein glysoja_013829 [Glycine soja]
MICHVLIEIMLLSAEHFVPNEGPETVGVSTRLQRRSLGLCYSHFQVFSSHPISCSAFFEKYT